MGYSGSLVQVGAKRQATQGTAATGAFDGFLCNPVEINPGIKMDEPGPQVGGSNYAMGYMTKTGVLIGWSIEARCTLENLQHGWEMLGAKATYDTTNTTTPFIRAFAPDTASDGAYWTLLWAAPGGQMRLVDALATELTLSVNAQAVVTMTLRGSAIRLETTSSATITMDSGQLTAISSFGGRPTILGATTRAIRALSLTFTRNADTGQGEVGSPYVSDLPTKRGSFGERENIVR